jgi:hypothetical protein
VNVFKEPVVVSIESIRFFNPIVVVAKLEDKLPMEELNPDVVVATELDKLPILVDILELNVEYPVVPVISICDEPDAIPEGIPVNPEYVICDEPDTSVGLFVRLL